MVLKKRGPKRLAAPPAISTQQIAFSWRVKCPYSGQQVRISNIQVTNNENFSLTYVQNTGAYGKQCYSVA